MTTQHPRRGGNEDEMSEQKQFSYDGHGINENGRRLATFTQSAKMDGTGNRLGPLFAAAPELVEVLAALIRLCPSKEGLGGRAPIGAFLLVGDRARAALEKAGVTV